MYDYPMHDESYSILNDLKLRNDNIIRYATKYDQLKGIVTGNIDFLILTETKLNNTFPQVQFLIDGYL